MFGTKLCCILLPVDIRGTEEGRKEETVADLGATSALAEQTGSESLVEQEMPQLLHAGSVTFWCCGIIFVTMYICIFVYMYICIYVDM